MRVHVMWIWAPEGADPAWPFAQEAKEPQAVTDDVVLALLRLLRDLRGYT